MKQVINKAYVPLLCLLAATPLLLLKPSLQSLILILCSISIVAGVVVNKPAFNKKAWPFIICFAILTAHYLFYFSGKSLKLTADALLIFLLPVAAAMLNTTKPAQYKKNIMLIYCSAIALLSLMALAFVVYTQKAHNYDWYLARMQLENATKLHGTYASLWVAVAILFLLFHFFDGPKKWGYRLLLIFMFTCYLLVLLTYNSRNITLGLIFIGVIMLIRQRKKIHIAVKVAFAVFVVLFLFLAKRYVLELTEMLNNNGQESLRYTINSCSFQTIYNAHFMGIDHTKIQDLLDACYKSKHLEVPDTFIYNSHNQYIDFFLKGGILLFISFVALVIFKIRLAYKSGNALYLCICILFALSFLTENVLVRQFGIYIYVFCDILLLGEVWGGRKGHADNKIVESQGGYKQGTAITHA